MNIQKHYIHYIVCMLVASLSISSCSKNEDTDPRPAEGSGTIYFENYEGFMSIDLSNREKTLLRKTGTHYNWHVTADGSTLMEMTNGRADGHANSIKFTISALKTGENINDFFYYPLNGGSIYQAADLSPDKQMICIFPSFEEGFVFLNAKNGELIGHIEEINGEAVPRYQSFAWMPDNSLLIKWKNYLLRTKIPFDEVNVIKEFDTDDFGSLAVNRQGTQVSMNFKGHIAIMNTDGSGFYMATAGDQIEQGSAFSPDGKHLVVGTNFRTIGVPGSVPSSQSYMQIIPVDGKTYRVDQEDPNIVPVIAKGETIAEPVKGLMVWVSH